ncbi:MAG: acetate--CoA ligase family protein [Rhodoferax sp.]|nr:acetate--CoA ligase family protein [Rhodoferax sp.]
MSAPAALAAAPAEHAAPEDASRARLQRLFSPRHIAVFGGSSAAEAIRQCRKLGYGGQLWPVHPTRETVEGIACYPDVAALPDAPDASFVAVPRHATVDIVGQLAARGAGGVICYASGFAEVGGEGVALQQQLVHNAGDMALLGPNCYGMLNYLDGVALWPDQHGGQRVERGVALITQSGNIGLNLTMQRRALPLAYLITVGNKAGNSMESLVDALLADRRVSVIGMHIEGLDDVAAFSRVALKALRQGVPLVALKAGSSTLGAQTAMSHTSSLAGPDALYDALFERCGVARVRDPAGLIETCKFLHVHGPLGGRRIISASCSGGEASLVADLAQPRVLDMPAIPAAAQARLYAVLGDKVTVANPLDYHTYIWGDLAAQTECFSGLMDCGFDAHLLVLDYPRLDRCSADSWGTTVDAFVAAAHAGDRTGKKAATVVASLPEDLPEVHAQALMARGIAPMHGLPDCLDAIAHAAQLGAATQAQAGLIPLLPVQALQAGTPRTLDEAASKRALAAFGLPVPQGQVVAAAQVVQAAEALGYPVVLKAVSDQLAHKTEAGAVHLNLTNAAQVQAALNRMAGLSERFLVEQMASNVVAEVIVGVQRDAQFGLSLTVGAGGVLVELLQDARTLLFPVQRHDVHAALQTLKVWPLLRGFRGRPGSDLTALVDAVMAVADYAQANAHCLLELDVNPVLVMPDGVLAVDALIRLQGVAHV